jgi:hypothetical protein
VPVPYRVNLRYRGVSEGMSAVILDAIETLDDCNTTRCNLRAIFSSEFELFNTQGLLFGTLSLIHQVCFSSFYSFIGPFDIAKSNH